MNLIERLKAAKHLVVFTGAGMSAESGVPTFRDAQTGLWAQFRPEDLATPQAFAAHPSRVWDWYAWRRGLVQKAAPHEGHIALAELEMKIPKMTLITQNVDGLHHRAGSRTVIELHGNITRIRCSECGEPCEEFPDHSPPPCPLCGAYLRPDVVWFGESLPREALEASFRVCETADVFLSIGTSTLVQPAAMLPFKARELGAFTVEINPEPTPFSASAHLVLREPARLALPRLLLEAFGQPA
ncbi:MAG: NAD-dependent deacylase [Acidobacteria bacterium]|nr:NAD-dependent deacylase [Acidobacteriota bacterium]